MQPCHGSFATSPAASFGNLDAVIATRHESTEAVVVSAGLVHCRKRELLSQRAFGVQATLLRASDLD